ncbi:EF-hand domain-containing protein [Actinokineospora cianjurensis]|uniref:Ca2+-binding EF-hand superfamily protein n=1 Tax=Actinokineospora cianjurensis TaxID=585224 RepID=A0A421BC22_9PSEU|nr:EF-hand domain-containing protein [Actinokineospora cianjurensis]RLK61893.1 Ca2+-binding EF-hand superfamily protein [Actinokineospora cianjurensis]
MIVIMDLGELLTTKIGRGFDHLDADGDGVLDERDHVLMGERVAEALGHVPGSPGERRIVDTYLRIWREVHLPHVPDGETGIARASFITSTGALTGDPETARATLGALAEAFLDLADVDADGTVSPREFLAFQRGHFPNLSAADAAAAFAHLDTDGDGTLSTGEFINATIEYWTSPDPDAPGNWWLGDPHR